MKLISSLKNQTLSINTSWSSLDSAGARGSLTTTCRKNSTSLSCRPCFNGCCPGFHFVGSHDVESTKPGQVHIPASGGGVNQVPVLYAGGGEAALKVGANRGISVASSSPTLAEKRAVAVHTAGGMVWASKDGERLDVQLSPAVTDFGRRPICIPVVQPVEVTTHPHTTLHPTQPIPSNSKPASRLEPRSVAGSE